MSTYLDELRAKAEEEFAARQSQQATVEQPLSAEELEELGVPQQTEQPQETVIEEQPAAIAESAAAPPAEPRKKNVYSRVIDLGDGSPPQVFRAATKDELIEKIASAQANASRRIRELKNQLKTKVEPDPAPPKPTFEQKKLTPEEEFILGQEIQTAPTEALSKALQALLGAPVDELKSALEFTRASKQREEIIRVGQQFVAANPDYPAGDKKAEGLMANYIQKNNLAWTVKNLEIAFDELREAGLISVAEPQAPTITVADEEEEPVLERPSPAAPVVVNQTPQSTQNQPALPSNVTEEPRRRRTVVGVSSSQTVAAVENHKPHEVSVDDLLKLSPSERRRIVLQSVGRG